MKKNERIEKDTRDSVKLKTRTPDTIYDDESGELVTITDEMRDEFWDRYEALKGHLFEASKQLYTIKEKRLYLAAGFNSFKAFYESVGISKRNALRQLKVGEKVQLLNDAGANNTEKVPTLAPSVHQNVHHFENMGYVKFYELSRLSQEQFAALMAGEEVAGYTINDFDKMTARELAHTISQVKKGNDKDSVVRLKEKAAILKSENEVLKRYKKETEEELKELRELEMKYGPLERGYRQKIAYMTAAQKHLDAFLKLMKKVKIEEDDAPTVLKQATGIVEAVRNFWTEGQGLAFEARLREVLGE